MSVSDQNAVAAPEAAAAGEAEPLSGEWPRRFGVLLGGRRSPLRSEDSWLLLILCIGAAVALLGSAFWAEFAQTLVYYSILCVGLNIVMGLAGLLDFGHAAFFAVGAYAAAKVMIAAPGLNFLLVLLVAMAVAAFASFLLGFPVFRMRGDFVALMTVAIAEIVAVLANNITWVGGAVGLTGVPLPTAFGITFDTNKRFLWVGLALFALVVVLARLISRVRFGRALLALREDDLAAQCVGIRPLRYRIAAYTVAGAFAGIAGGYFAGMFGYVGPGSFGIGQSFLIGEAVILGGLGSVLGSVLGAGVLVGLQNLLVDYVPQVAGHGDLILGVLVLVIILARPQGLLGKPFMRKRN